MSFLLSLCFYFVLCIIPSYGSNCSDVVYDSYGKVSISWTLRRCVGSIGDPMLPPSYDGTINTTIVESDMIVNNLQSIDELEGSATLDFYFRLFWIDHRLNVPEMWAALNPEVVAQGAEITNILTENEEKALNIWLPDIHFVDGQAVEYFGSTLRLYPGGALAWSRHTVLSVQNPYFNYKPYPSDTQTIEIRFESYAYPTAFVTLKLREPAVMFVENDGRENFKNNPMWDFKSSNAFEILAVFSPIRSFTTATVQLDVSRRSSGVIIRLVLPIVLLVFLSGFTFWAEKDTRTDSTITLLLAVSALYIVVFSNIPMLGYLTNLDRYISYIFLLLTLCCFVHQSVMRMADKHVHWPLRAVYIRLLEAAGRLIVIPFTILLFQVAFPMTSSVQAAMIAAVVIYLSFVGAREVGGVIKAFKRSMFGIRDKADHPTEHKFSSLEMLLFNLWFYGVPSRSLSVHIRYRAKAMRKLEMYDMSRQTSGSMSSVRNQMSADNKSDDGDRFSL